MKKITWAFLIIISTLNVYGQFKEPRNIDEAVHAFIKSSSDSVKKVIISTKDESLIYLPAPWTSDVHSYKKIYDWSFPPENSRTPLVKYYSHIGIKSPDHIEQIIFLCVKQYLIRGKYNHDSIAKTFQVLEKKWKDEDKVRYTTDSLRGFYIPKNLDECLTIIDTIWSDSTKNVVKKMGEEEFIGKAHLNFGTWMRNSWQLWKGSRLTYYFAKRGIGPAESISSIILVSYYRHLKSIPIDFENQIQKERTSLMATREPTKNMYPKGVKNLEFNTCFFYDSQKNGQALIQIGTNKKNSDIWLYDYYFGWKKISKEQLSEFDVKAENREAILFRIFNKEP